MSNQGVASSKVTNNFLVGYLFPDDARCQAGPTKPNTVMPRGTVVGLVTSANVTPVQTITTGSTAASGSWGFQIAPTGGAIVQSNLLAWNASLATVQLEADRVFGAGNIVVSGTLNAGFVFTGAGALLYGALPAITVYSNSLLTSVPAAVVLTVTQTTAGVKFGVLAAYASGNSDGSQTAVGLLETDVYTDIYGNITYGLQPGSGNGPGLTARYAVKGFFKVADTVGLDATAVTALGRITAGTLGKRGNPFGSIG